jgi:hypothetical protein
MTDAAVQRLKTIAATTPFWLKCLWTGIALALTALGLFASIYNLIPLFQPQGDGNFLKLIFSVLALVIALLLLAAARDLWMLPKILDRKAKTWLL